MKMFQNPFFMGFPTFPTLSLQPDFNSSLSMQMFGVHSPSRHLVYILQADVGIFKISYAFQWHFTVFIEI